MTRVFVFGSNLAGRHGKGAALYAVKFYGAIYGQGVGRQGNAYAIPTKDNGVAGYLRPLPLWAIEQYIEEFIEYAKAHPEIEFLLTPVGCGLAGYSRKQIRPLFKGVTENVTFLEEWEQKENE